MKSVHSRVRRVPWMREATSAPEIPVMAKGQVNKGKQNKPKLTAKEKDAKRKEKRAKKAGA